MIRVLLADDEPLVLIGLQGMLEWEKLGYTICGTARNGRQALETIQQEKPDIVVADVKMPLMDGLTLARTCREKGPLPVFIILTSFEQFDYVRQAMGAGAVDYLVKLELTPESLTAALARAAERVKKGTGADGGAACPLRHGRRTAQLPGQFFYAAVRRDVSAGRGAGSAAAPVGGRPCGGPVSSGQL